MNKNSTAFREDFLQDRDRISEHGIDSCHNYFGISEKQYLLKETDARVLIEKLKKKYVILTLDGIDCHGYDNTYMDTKDFDIYTRESKEKSNLMVRTRAYKRHDITYFQMKHRTNERTNVYSHIYQDIDSKQLTPAMRGYFCGVYESITGRQPEKLIFPAVQVSYDRYILYDKKGGERVDIDFNIRFTDLRNPKHPSFSLENIVMIESKSSAKNSKIAKILEKENTKKTSVGIYPLALHYIDYPTQNKQVEKTVKQIMKLQKG